MSCVGADANFFMPSFITQHWHLVVAKMNDFFLIYVQLWNVERRQCTRTIPTTSISHDVAGCPNINSIISGHFDKKLRIWNLDQPAPNVQEILLSGRISGIDVSLGELWLEMDLCIAPQKAKLPIGKRQVAHEEHVAAKRQYV